MPEELSIALVVLCAIGWVIYKIIAGISDASTRSRNRQFENRRKSLAGQLRAFLPNELGAAEELIRSAQREFDRARRNSVWKAELPKWERVEFTAGNLSTQGDATQRLDISDLDAILCPNKRPWQKQEQELLSRSCSYPGTFSPAKRLCFRPFSIPTLTMAPAALEGVSDINEIELQRYFQRECNAVSAYNRQREEVLAKHAALVSSITTWNQKEEDKWKQYSDEFDVLHREQETLFNHQRKKYENECQQLQTEISQVLNGICDKDSLLKRVNLILSSLQIPRSLPRFWNLDYDEAEQILIAEIALPDVVHQPPTKTVQLKSGKTIKPLNKTELKELVPKFHPAIMLRVAFEILRNDDSGTIKLLALNGWVDYVESHTGRETRAYTASLIVKRGQIEALNLQYVDPLAAFHALRGKSSGKLIEIIPIEPSLNLNRTDSRFVEAKAVLNSLDKTTNLAAMDWQDFEHLIRELFEKEFSARGAEVKITQASRDRGVDAIAFNPDPIHGGKYIIQAKRYTNTVDVSAVRDLCAVVRKEGASRGILVTTSTYGADAYEFANNEPVTLLNGGELLGLLEKHGYSFRVDLAEARRIRATSLNA